MIKRITTLVFVFLTIVGNAVWAQVSEKPSDMNGNGTVASPYELDSKEDLEWFRDYINNGNVTEREACAKLTDNIDLEGSAENPWTPIGKSVDPNECYRGTFDGGGFTIEGLYINTEEEQEEFEGTGLFGAIAGSEDGGVKNLRVKGTIRAIGVIGGICGRLGSDNFISNCHSEVDIEVVGVSGNQLEVGGICGFSSSLIEYCSNTGNITISVSNVTNSTEFDTYAIGGIVGVADKVSHSYNAGTITLSGTNNKGEYFTGGVCGIHTAPAAIESCYNTGTITTSDFTGDGCIKYIGGIVGAQQGVWVATYSAKTKNCYNTGTLEVGAISESNICGTICGQNNYLSQGIAVVENCYYLPQASLPVIGANAGENVAISKDEIAFKKGEVAYLLREYGFGQDLQDETITSPTLLYFNPDDAVYKLTLNYSEVDTEKETEEKFVNSKYLGLPELTTEEEGKRIGWFDENGNEYTSESEITEDITLTAQVTEQSEEPEEPEQPDDDEDQDQDTDKPGTIVKPIKYYNIYIDTICPGLEVEVSKDVVQEGHQVSAYLTIQAECDTTGMRFEYKRGLFGYWKDLKELEGVQPGEYIIKNIYTDIYIRALDATLPEEEPTGIEDLEGVKAYAKDSSIYVYTPNREEVTIISMSGAIIKHAEQVGLQSYSVNRGIYIVRIGEKVFKLKN